MVELEPAAADADPAMQAVSIDEELVKAERQLAAWQVSVVRRVGAWLASGRAVPRSWRLRGAHACAWANAIFTPPVLASTAGIVIGLAPPLKRLLFPVSATAVAASATAPGDQLAMWCLLPAAASNGSVTVVISPPGNGSWHAIVGPGGVAAPITCAAAAAATSPQVSQPLFGPTLTAALSSLAAAVTPVITVMLGSTIGERRAVAAPAEAAARRADKASAGDAAPPPRRIRWPILVAVCFARLLVMPMVGIAAVAAGVRAGVVPRGSWDAATLQFVLLLEASTPPALNLQLLAEVAGKGQREMAQVIAVTYCASIITLTGWISLFLVLAQRGSLG